MEVGVEDTLPGSGTGVGDQAVFSVAGRLGDLVGEGDGMPEASRIRHRRRSGVLVVLDAVQDEAPAGDAVREPSDRGAVVLGVTQVALEVVEAEDDVRHVAAAVRHPEPDDAGAVGADGDAQATADEVVHLAAKVSFAVDPADFVAVNVEGTRTLLAAARTAGVARFVFVSSPSVAHTGTPSR